MKDAKKQERPKRDEIKVRVNPSQRKMLTEAAERAGLGVSSWLRSLGLRQAAQDGVSP